MARLSGIEVYKLLPRTNCGDCGLPTCMAFAMQIASQKAALDGCPHVSGEARAALGEAQSPPMTTVAFGIGEEAVEVGGETVLYRHEGRFRRPAGLAVRIPSNLNDAAIDARLDAIGRLRFDRVGECVGVDAVAIDRATVSPRRYAEVAAHVAERTQRPLILMCEDPAVLAPVAERLAPRRPLLWAAGTGNSEAMTRIAAQLRLPLVVRADTLDTLATLAEQAKGAGVDDILLDPTTSCFGATLDRLIAIRRLALEKRVRSLGYPSFVRIGPASSMAQMCDAIGGVARYGSMIVLDTVDLWAILAVVTARLNLYTDPQVPSAVEARVVEFGNPGRDAPVLVTTNFALTYFTVAGEVENAKVPAYVCVMDTDGLGVLNAYADQRLTAESLVAAIREQGAMDRVDHNQLIIPGLLARLRIAIQEASGWDVLVGPEDASGIPRFLVDLLAKQEPSS